MPLPHPTSMYLVPDGSHTCAVLVLLHRLLPGVQMMAVHALPVHTSAPVQLEYVKPLPALLHVCSVTASVQRLLPTVHDVPLSGAHTPA